MSTTESLTIFTVNGYMGNMWVGPQAELGQHLSAVSPQAPNGLGLAFWQPIGYNSSEFPLSGGVTDGLAALRLARQQRPGPYLMGAWSEGAVISTEYLKTDMSDDFKGGAFYGNPYRAEGQWNPNGTAIGSVGDPGGAGVGGPKNNWRTPDTVHHYCHGPNQPSYDGLSGVDQYTCCSTGLDGDVARVFYNFVFSQWTGGFEEIMAVAGDLAKEAGTTVFAMIKCAIEWIEFFGGQCKPHTDYTSYAGAKYLEGIARSLP